VWSLIILLFSVFDAICKIFKSILNSFNKQLIIYISFDD